MNKDARKNMINTRDNLRQVQGFLRDAAESVENHTTKTRIEDQIDTIGNCLKECEGILSGLSQQ